MAFVLGDQINDFGAIECITNIDQQRMSLNLRATFPLL